MINQNIGQPRHQENSIEKQKMQLHNLPVADLLLKNRENSPIPDDIKNKPEFKNYFEKRKKLSESTEKIFDSVPPTLTIEEALDKKIIDAETITDFYNKYSEFLKSDTGNIRAALYTPFEILPRKNWKIENNDLDSANKNLLNTYKKSWEILLTMEDYRANFSDGDFLPDKKPKVIVKAAHLIPILLEKGIINFEEILKIFTESENLVLRNSIIDTVPTLLDNQQLNENDIAQLLSLNNYRLEEIIHEYQAHDNQEYPTNEKTVEKTFEKKSDLLKSIALDIKKDYEDNAETFHPQNSKGEDPARLKWLKNEAENDLLNKHSNTVKEKIINNELSSIDLERFLSNSNLVFNNIGILTLGKYIEEINITKPIAAKELANKLQATLAEIATRKPSLKDSIISTLSKLKSLEIITSDYLNSFNINIPELDKTNDLSKAEQENINSIIEKIRNNPELQKIVYPVLLAFGSRLKGYAQENADLDKALFIKPNTSWEEREKLIELISETFNEDDNMEQVVEFWLEEKNNNELEVKDVPKDENWIADKDWAHILFESSWQGDKEDIDELKKKLLPYYLKTKDKPEMQDQRLLWMREIERDMLQYRLMHKGYHRLQPKLGGIDTEHPEEINADSAFWDSGYRRTATKLYIDKILMPSI